MKCNKAACIALGLVILSGPLFAETCCEKAATTGKECKDKMLYHSS
jgi:hypothetical protein